MLSAAELASIQATASSALDLACTVQRRTKASDGTGTSSETWATVANVNAEMSQPSAGLLANYDFLIGSLSTWRVRFPTGTDVRHYDRLLISGDTLTVQVILTPQSYSSLLTVLASEVK